MSSEIKVPKLLTTRELSEATGIPRWRLFAMVAEGTSPPFLRVGKTYRFAEDAVVKWIAEQSNINPGETR